MDNVDPFNLMGKLVRKDNKSKSRVFEVIRVAGMYVKLGATKKHPKGAKRPDFTAKWYDYERLVKVDEQ